MADDSAGTGSQGPRPNKARPFTVGVVTGATMLGVWIVSGEPEVALGAAGLVLAFISLARGPSAP
jgi:hypothetical protein